MPLCSLIFYSPVSNLILISSSIFFLSDIVIFISRSLIFFLNAWNKVTIIVLVYFSVESNTCVSFELVSLDFSYYESQFSFSLHAL